MIGYQQLPTLRTVRHSWALRLQLYAQGLQGLLALVLACGMLLL